MERRTTWKCDSIVANKPTMHLGKIPSPGCYSAAFCSYEECDPFRERSKERVQVKDGLCQFVLSVVQFLSKSSVSHCAVILPPRRLVSRAHMNHRMSAFIRSHNGVKVAVLSVQRDTLLKKNDVCLNLARFLSWRSQANRSCCICRSMTATLER
jgi:hypothetical protein